MTEENDILRFSAVSNGHHGDTMLHVIVDKSTLKSIAHVCVCVSHTFSSFIFPFLGHSTSRSGLEKEKKTEVKGAPSFPRLPLPR